MSYVKIIPLGGVREFGLNSTALVTSKGSILIDAGIMFSRYASIGVDQIIPDFSYVKENQEAFQGIVLTHGHEDHIGALPYLLKDAPIPVYGHPFTIEMVRYKLNEYDINGNVSLNTVEDGDYINLAGMDIEFHSVKHSTLGCFSLVIHTPQGIIVHSGDFRDSPACYSNINSPVRLFICESTNAVHEPHCVDESKALENIDDIVSSTSGIVIVSTFSSHVERIQSLIEIAAKNGRKVSIMGKSMNQVMNIASELGYLYVNYQDLLDPELVLKMDRRKVMIICTGTQGEVYSALSLISRGWHKIKVQEGDSVIISARMIPGNETAITRCIDQLLDFGASVFYPEVADVHATGHAKHDEIRKFLYALRPEIVMPVHGEFRQMKALSEMVLASDLDGTRVVLPRVGQEWTLDKDGIQITGNVPHGKCFVDGEFTGDIKDVVLRDRRHISEGGFVVALIVMDGNSYGLVLGPEVMCKGVVPASMEQEIVGLLKQKAKDIVNFLDDTELNVQSLKSRLREGLGRELKARLGKKPMVIPIIMEI